MSPSTGWFSWSSTTPIYSPGSSSTTIYSLGSSTPPRYSLGASTPAQCSNCKHLLDKITQYIFEEQATDSVLTYVEAAKLLNSLLKLRQACCHPQVGSSGLRALQQSPMTMEEILMVLVELAEEHSQDFKVGPLLNIHIHYSLAEILPLTSDSLKQSHLGKPYTECSGSRKCEGNMCKTSDGNGYNQPNTLTSSNDEKHIVYKRRSTSSKSTSFQSFHMTCNKFKKNFLSFFNSKLSAAQQEFRKSYELVSNAHNDRINEHTGWWAKALQCIEENKDVSTDLIRKIGDVVSRTLSTLRTTRLTAWCCDLDGEGLGKPLTMKMSEKQEYAPSSDAIAMNLLRFPMVKGGPSHSRISSRSRSKSAGGKNRLMKAVQSSSHVSIVPSLSSASHVFASPVSDRGNIIRRTASFSPAMFLLLQLVIGETSLGGQLRSRDDITFVDPLNKFIAIIKQEFPQVVSLYKEALELAEEHSEDFRVDPLINIHIHYRLAEILPLTSDSLQQSQLGKPYTECSGFGKCEGFMNFSFVVSQIFLKVSNAHNDRINEHTAWWAKALQCIEENKDVSTDFIRKIGDVVSGTLSIFRTSRLTAWCCDLNGEGLGKPLTMEMSEKQEYAPSSDAIEMNLLRFPMVKGGPSNSSMEVANSLTTLQPSDPSPEFRQQPSMVSLTIMFYHEGIFVGPPLEYLEGSKDTIKDLDFENFTYGNFNCIKAATLFPHVGLFYCLPGSDLSDGIRELKNEQQLADFVAAALGNGRHIDVYVEHHRYDIHDWFVKDNDDLEDCDEDEYKQEDRSVDPIYKVKPGIVYPDHGPYQPWKDMVPILGMKFKDHEEMKMMLANYGVANGYQLWYKRNDYKSLLVLCSRNVIEGRWIARHYVRDIVSNPKISYRELQDAIREKFLINVSLGQVIRAKQRALYDFKGGKVIGLDGCFLKGTIKGELLTAMGRDANNHIFLIASCEAFENGICKSYHAAIINQRGKPIITMLEDITICLMRMDATASGSGLGKEEDADPANADHANANHANADPREMEHVEMEQLVHMEEPVQEANVQEPVLRRGLRLRRPSQMILLNKWKKPF
nr:E3 ubiquitin-protein ligase SHPRH [Tanacetum cinerariifolium]